MKEVLHRSLIISEGLLVVFGFVLLCSFIGETDSFLRMTDIMTKKNLGNLGIMSPLEEANVSSACFYVLSFFIC